METFHQITNCSSRACFQHGKSDQWSRTVIVRSRSQSVSGDLGRNQNEKDDEDQTKYINDGNLITSLIGVRVGVHTLSRKKCKVCHDGDHSAD